MAFDGPSPFDGDPVFNYVDSLKKAIKAEKPQELATVDADWLTLYTIDADGTISDTACDPEHALHPATKYAFERPV